MSPGARVWRYQGQPQGCRPALRPGLGDEVFNRAGETGKPEDHGHGMRACLGRQINGEGRGTAQRFRGVLEAQLPPADEQRRWGSPRSLVNHHGRMLSRRASDQGRVDLIERHGVGDEVIDIQTPLHVPINDLWHIGAAQARRRRYLASSPSPVGRAGCILPAPPPVMAFSPARPTLRADA